MCDVCGGGGGGADVMYDTCLCRYAPTHATNSGGRTPGSKLPASPPPLPRPDGGGTPGRVPVYTAQKRQAGLKLQSLHIILHSLDHAHLWNL